jgi:hypothetical protein
VTLRNVILAICALIVVASIVEFALGQRSWLLFGVQAIVVLALILFERGRYRPPIGSTGEWVPTGERFEDPSSGKTVEVYQNPRTGEREYRGSA